MKRTMFAVSALIGIVMAGACGSADTAPGGTGTLVVQLTDAPFPLDSVKSVDIFVVRVDGRTEEVDDATADQHVATEAESEGDGWKTLATPNASINLLVLQNGVVSTVGEAKIAAASYRGFRLVIDPSKSSVTLKNNQVLTSTSSPSVAFPSASRSGIKIVLAAPVVVGEDGKTTMVVDFDVGSSFVMRGNSLSQNGLLFKPVIRATVK
jgi:Domain of unknown function (DUF4382)